MHSNLEVRPGEAMPTRHLNQRELAERWNISARTLERWRWLGKGPRYLKIGGRCVYALADVVAFEAEQLRQSTSAPILGTWRQRSTLARRRATIMPIKPPSVRGP